MAGKFRSLTTDSSCLCVEGVSLSDTEQSAPSGGLNSATAPHTGRPRAVYFAPVKSASIAICFMQRTDQNARDKRRVEADERESAERCSGRRDKLSANAGRHADSWDAVRLPVDNNRAVRHLSRRARLQRDAGRQRRRDTSCRRAVDSGDTRDPEGGRVAQPNLFVEQARVVMLVHLS
jgi:hypothetical protein